MKRIASFVLALIPLSAAALGPDKACFRRGVDSEDICAVSLSTLIARGEDFDKKNVIIKGFYAYAEKPMLFTSRDAFLMSDAADGVVVRIPENVALAKILASADHQYVVIVGRYHAHAADLSYIAGGLRTGGSLTEITSAGATGDQPWGYSLPTLPDLKKRSP